jgi:pyrimidine operon attenuation protein/uracil phosphoribosyltransferase
MKEILNSKDIDSTLSRIAEEIVERNKGVQDLCLIGIQRGGAHLAKRLAEKIRIMVNKDVPVGTLDISFYRDDITIRRERPIVRKTDIAFDITDRKVILVDDVLFTGRSIRAAMDALMDIGRPLEIQLAVLIDRGHREFPICPQYTGKDVFTEMDETIEVELSEEGHRDRVLIIDKGSQKRDDA